MKNSKLPAASFGSDFGQRWWSGVGTQTEVCVTGGSLYYERNLPHWVPAGKDVFVTWRLSGSLPAKLMEKLRGKKEMPEGRRFAEFEKHLDAGSFGPVWLGDGRIAEIVVERILELETDGKGKVHAFAVMPNHVHLLLEPRIELPKIMKIVKGATA